MSLDRVRISSCAPYGVEHCCHRDRPDSEIVEKTDGASTAEHAAQMLYTGVFERLPGRRGNTPSSCNPASPQGSFETAVAPGIDGSSPRSGEARTSHGREKHTSGTIPNAHHRSVQSQSQWSFPVAIELSGNSIDEGVSAFVQVASSASSTSSAEGWMGTYSPDDWN